MFVKNYLLGFVLMFAAFAFQVNAQDDAPIQLGNKKISKQVFEKLYRQLVESDSIKADNKQQFLNDYIDYQFKILAAEEAKIPNSASFQEEYQSFRKELASPYLIDSEKVDSLVREAYQRLKFEKQVAQILVKLPPIPSAADTVLAYKKISTIQQKIAAGESFERLAKKYSEDELSAMKGGMLGFVTSLQTQYAFENAVYRLEKGAVSNIVRTSTGYHLIKILDIRPNQGKIRLAHILVSVGVNAPSAQQVDAKNRIDQVQKYIEKGDDTFELICKNYSEDPYSKGRGGELRRWYYAADLSEELQNKLFTIQRLGDVTEPIRTNLGWQVFKLLDKKPLLSYEEMAEYLRQKVMTDPERSALIRASFMKRVRRENNVQINEAAQKIALERFAQDRVGDEYYLKMPLVQILDKTYTIQTFYQFIVAQQKRKLKELGYLPSIAESTWLDEFVDTHTLIAEEQHLETKYPAFKDQMLEFYEGSLFSKITEQVIFDASLDSLRQQAYFKEHAVDFTLATRVHAKILDADSPKTLVDAMEVLSKGPYLLNKRLPDVNFTLGSSQVKEGDQKILQELFMVLAKNRDQLVEVSGHHDLTEADTVADARINHVVAYLTKKGIPATRIITTSLGAIKPISKADKTKNARVSFHFFSNSMEDAVKRFNAVKPASLRAEEGFYEKGQQSILDGLPWVVGKQQIDVAGRYVFVDIMQVEPERLKRFDESRSTVIRALQDQLGKSWLANLKSTYPVVLRTEELAKIMQ